MALKQVQLYVRVGPAEFIYDGREYEGGEEIGAAHGQAAGFQLLEIAHIVGEFIFQVHDFLGGLYVLFAAFRQLDGAGAPVKEGHAYLCLNLLDHGTEGRLGYVKVLSSLGKALFLIDFIYVIHPAEHSCTSYKFLIISFIQI